MGLTRCACDPVATPHALPGHLLVGILSFVNAYGMPRGAFMTRLVSPTPKGWGFFTHQK
jgi:hypothetical protein